MKKNFDFSKIGKRTPYSMPSGFVEQMEEHLWQELREDHAHTMITLSAGATMRTKSGAIFRSLVTAAAAATLLLVYHSTILVKHSDNFSDIERAFDNLSYDDQQFMMDAEANDMFALVSGDQATPED